MIFLLTRVVHLTWDITCGLSPQKTRQSSENIRIVLAAVMENPAATSPLGLRRRPGQPRHRLLPPDHREQLVDRLGHRRAGELHPDRLQEVAERHPFRLD